MVLNLSGLNCQSFHLLPNKGSKYAGFGNHFSVYTPQKNRGGGGGSEFLFVAM